jgi:hypothetical protein
MMALNPASPFRSLVGSTIHAEAGGATYSGGFIFDPGSVESQGIIISNNFMNESLGVQDGSSLTNTPILRRRRTVSAMLRPRSMRFHRRPPAFPPRSQVTHRGSSAIGARPARKLTPQSPA